MTHLTESLGILEALTRGLWGEKTGSWAKINSAEPAMWVSEHVTVALQTWGLGLCGSDKQKMCFKLWNVSRLSLLPEREAYARHDLLSEARPIDNDSRVTSLALLMKARSGVDFVSVNFSLPQRKHSDWGQCFGPNWLKAPFGLLIGLLEKEGKIHVRWSWRWKGVVEWYGKENWSKFVTPKRTFRCLHIFSLKIIEHFGSDAIPPRTTCNHTWK